MTTQIMVQFLRNVLDASQLESSRGKLDVFTDRLTKASTEPNLSSAMEHLLRAVNASAERLHPPLAAKVMGIANSTDAPRVLRWIREQPKLITMLAATRDDSIIEEALAELVLPELVAGGAAAPRQPCAIKIKATCETPLAHGADGKAGNATLFRRIQVLATNGSVLELPYYSGNAVRGQLRDLLADHFLRSLDLIKERSKPSIALWFFYALYSGGALEEKSDATKAMKKQLGDNGAIRSDGIREFRTHLPTMSLLGCALGNRVLPGHLQVADLRPVCAEWGTGTRPVVELMTWEFLTRREDYEDHVENHSMITNTEVLRAGTVLEGGIDVDTAIPSLELSALGKGLSLLKSRGFLGAENRRGFGKVAIELADVPDPSEYESWIADNKASVIAYLETIGAKDK